VTNKLIRPVTKQYIAGVTAIAPAPARCYTQTITRTTSGSVSTTNTFVSIDEVTNGGISFGGFAAPVYRTVPAYIDLSGQIVTQELVGWNVLRFAPGDPIYTTTTETICTPAIEGREGVAAQIIEQNAGPDWQASALSIESRSGGVTAAFNVNSSPRVIIGFSTRDSGAAQGDIRMGVAFVTAGTTTNVAPILNGVVQASVATYTPGDRVTLVRVGGRFYINLAGTMVYGADATTEEDVFLDAMLYTSNDFIDSPKLGPAETTPVSGGFGFTPRLSTVTGVSGPVGFYSDANTLVGGLLNVSINSKFGFTATTLSVIQQGVAISGVFGFEKTIRSGVFLFLRDPLLSLDNTTISGATEVLGPVVVRASAYPYSYGEPKLKLFELVARGGELSQSVAGADLVLAPMPSYSTMLTGGLINSELALKQLVMFAADSAYGGGGLAIPSLRVYGDDGFGIPNYYGYNEGLVLSAPMFTDPSLFASMYETLELETEITLTALLSGTLFEGLILAPSLSVTDFLSAMIESGINLSSATQTPDLAVAQYAFNSLTGAATRYSNFGFTQFARAGQQTFAIKPDGLYRLRRGDDNGELRSALVDFGALAMSTQQSKNLETLFLGMDTDGTVYAKLTGDDGEELIYRAVERESTMRVSPGRGASAREWRLKLEIFDAERANLDSIEFFVAVSSRRRTK
jgi:hypothetical protein